MDEKQLLNAIHQMIQEENKPIYDRLDKIEEDVRQTGAFIEHVEHNISLVAEQYTTIAKKLEAIKFEAVSDVFDLQDRVRILERVVTSHTDQINELKRRNQ